MSITTSSPMGAVDLLRLVGSSRAQRRRLLTWSLPPRPRSDDGPRRVASVIGTRPEAIKMALLHRALEDDPDVEARLIITGQHREMLEQVLDHFDLSPDAALDIEPSDGLAGMLGSQVSALGACLDGVDPDLVVVQGDTSTALAGAMAAFLGQRPSVHVEAGLRTHDVLAPFPEEMNRRLITQLASLHLAPTQTAGRSLAVDGVGPHEMVVTGNTVIDALLWSAGRALPLPSGTQLATHDGPVLLVTAHRRESWGEGLAEVARALRSIAERHPELLVAFPIHRNPIVRSCVVGYLEGLANVELLEPLGYADFVAAMERSTLLLTDSGGIQEEAPSLGKPVIVTRSTTERPEGVAAGTAVLAGTDHDAIVSNVERLLGDRSAYERMARAHNPYGDGLAVERSHGAIRQFLGLPSEVRPFIPGRSRPGLRSATLNAPS